MAGDGNRVKSVMGGVTTYYVGNHFEWTGDTTSMVKYYYADGQRVAMRQGSSTVYYLLGDHLGSTSLTASSSGSKVAELRYHPWGGTRFTSGTTPTSYQFTGQRNDYYIKLYHMGARMYDPELGRFISPDSIVPDFSNPQSLNRYAYVYNNPLKFHDPTGHAPKWVDFLVGVTYQVANDMSYGVFNAILSSADPFWDTRQGEGFYAGQQVGRNLSQAIGGTLMIDGVAKAAAGAAAMGPTAGLAAATAGPTAGGSVVVGGVALSGEAAMVLGGVAEAAYGAGIMAYTRLNPLPERGSGAGGWGANNSQTRTIKGYKVRVDWESAGSNGNVHVTVNGEKVFIDDPSDLSALPRSLRKNQWVQQQVDHAFTLMQGFESGQ